MTKLRVLYSCGKFAMEPYLVDVADDEEYWFADDCLMVGTRDVAELPNGIGHIRYRPAKTRLHIFNLCRVEVIE